MQEKLKKNIDKPTITLTDFNMLLSVLYSIIENALNQQVYGRAEGHHQPT